jgi:hypothetical protein
MVTTSIMRVIFVDNETESLFSDRTLSIPLLCRKHNCTAWISSTKEIYCGTGHPLIIDFPYEIMERDAERSSDKTPNNASS